MTGGCNPCNRHSYRSPTRPPYQPQVLNSSPPSTLNQSTVVNHHWVWHVGPLVHANCKGPVVLVSSGSLKRLHCYILRPSFLCQQNGPLSKWVQCCHVTRRFAKHGETLQVERSTSLWCDLLDSLDKTKPQPDQPATEIKI